MISLTTIAAVFLILIGVNICIFIGKKAYGTHVLLRDTVSYILLQYGVGVLVIYLIYIEVMGLFGIDARPSITRELILWSVLTLATASISYLVSKLAVSPSDGILYNIHNVLLHRLMDGTKPEAWRATMRQFEFELSKATKYQTYSYLLPKFLQRKAVSEVKIGEMQKKSSVEITEIMPTSRVCVDSDRFCQQQEDVLEKEASTILKPLLTTSSKNISSILKPLLASSCENISSILSESGSMVEHAMVVVTTILKHWWIRISGLRITLGSVDDYYKEVKVDKRARIPCRQLPPLMRSKRVLNLQECSGDSNVSGVSFE